jgi:hypothetical protein
LIQLTEKPDGKLPVARLGNSGEVKPGDWVMAIGNPFNLARLREGHMFVPAAIEELHSSQNHVDSPSPRCVNDAQDQPRACPDCHRYMTLRELRDYGTPLDLPRVVMRVVRWECLCGRTDLR